MCVRIHQWDEKAVIRRWKRLNASHLSKKMAGGPWIHVKTLCFSVCRKEQSILSPVNCWNLLLLQVKRESRDHATLSDLYLNNIIPRFAQISEDSGRLFKKVTHTQAHTGHGRIVDHTSSKVFVFATCSSGPICIVTIKWDVCVGKYSIMIWNTPWARFLSTWYQLTF